MNTLITPVSDGKDQDTAYGGDERPERTERIQRTSDINVTAADDPRDMRGRSDGSYLQDHESSQAGERWQRIQAEFVDDPRESVAQAHQLVSDLMQRIIETFTNERSQLEHQWSEGQSVSTEDLRVCLQRYRSFFTRLLPLGQRPIEER